MFLFSYQNFFTFIFSIFKFLKLNFQISIILFNKINYLMMKCAICSNAEPKYKCPKCRINYCSLKCWKSHSSQNCEPFKETLPLRESTLENFMYKTEDTVPPEKLKLLEHSEGVLATLRNPHVRRIIDLIDKSDNPAVDLKEAMAEPIFVEFVEECLKIVEPEEELT
ncbi:zinc finger HIT domain-containing protein 3 [Planococcus citri]|uniref:zinc finger HIT domain-containing protein 3 n=1 Tax=Planococcus citri TaxID=170843 RepID=UPI0031F94C98